jgi:hypothetical protein
MTPLAESFTICCRNIYLAGLKPFGFDMLENRDFIKLQMIAEGLTLRHLYEYFLENQYYINLWAAIFILDKFKPALGEKLIGLNDQISIVDECMEILERHSEYFDEPQHQNYHSWIKKIKTYYHLT